MGSSVYQKAMGLEARTNSTPTGGTSVGKQGGAGFWSIIEYCIFCGCDIRNLDTHRVGTTTLQIDDEKDVLVHSSCLETFKKVRKRLRGE